MNWPSFERRSRGRSHLPDNLTDAVRAAFDQTRFSDIITRVHGAVLERLVELDPTVKIERTNYFNHSFVPDFVMTWPEANSKQSRDIFLRYDLESAQAAGDVSALGGDGGVLLSLDTDTDVALAGA